jgi:hypothetical protein
MLVVAATERELALVRSAETFVCGVGPVEAAARTARMLAARRIDPSNRLLLVHVGLAGARRIAPPALLLGSESV